MKNIKYLGRYKRSGDDPVVVKFRRLNTPQSRLDFQKEILYLRKLENARYIRRILDVIEDPADNTIDHAMVLEWFPETLWEARENGHLSSFGLMGIRKIMKDILEGIQELHSRGFIHLDIKAQNILLNGISAKLSDLGSIWPGILNSDPLETKLTFGYQASPPSKGTAQPMPYRSPEILFGLKWSKEVDIWGWGMYIHMIQAYIRPDIWGLYDRLPEESTPDTIGTYEERIRQDIFHDFRLISIPFYEDCKHQWPESDPDRKDVTIRSILEYLEFPDNEINFLEKVLNPDPTTRPTAKEILDSGWLDVPLEDHLEAEGKIQ